MWCLVELESAPILDINSARSFIKSCAKNINQKFSTKFCNIFGVDHLTRTASTYDQRSKVTTPGANHKNIFAVIYAIRKSYETILI